MKSLDKNEALALLANFKDNANAIIAVAAVLFLLDVGFIMRFQFVSIGKMFKEADKLKTGIKSTRDDAKFLSSFKNRVEDLKKEHDSLDKMAIAEEDVPTALESISKFADISAVRILKIRPILEASSEIKNINKGAIKGAQTFSRHKVSITAKCGFHELSRFVAMLEGAPIFFDIKNLEIQTDQQDFTKHSVTIIVELVVRKS